MEVAEINFKKNVLKDKLYSFEWKSVMSFSNLEFFFYRDIE